MTYSDVGLGSVVRFVISIDDGSNSLVTTRKGRKKRKNELSYFFASFLTPASFGRRLGNFFLERESHTSRGEKRNKRLTTPGVGPV